MSSNRRHVDRRVRGLRLALKTETDLGALAHRFFDIVGDPAVDHACSPCRDPAIAAMMFAIAEKAGYVAPDPNGAARVMTMAYSPEGFYHGMVAPLPVLFFFFRKDRQGLLIQSALDGRPTQLTRFVAFEAGRDPIPVPGPSTLQ